MSRFVPTITGGPTSILVDSPVMNPIQSSTFYESFEQKSTTQTSPSVKTITPTPVSEKKQSSISPIWIIVISIIIIILAIMWSDFKQSIYRYFFPKGPFIYV